jgi:uncharacterized repeat protein (TIGR04138 family)
MLSQTRVDIHGSRENHSSMPCHVCGSEWANFYTQGPAVAGSEPERRAYCEACFVATFGEDNPMVREMRAHARQRREKEIDDKIARDMESLRTRFRPKIEKLIAKEPRFTFEAYEFIYASLTRAVHETPLQPGERGRHATAAEFVRACGEQARRAWGENARAHAQSLGFTSASDIGDIIFLLVDNGYMGKRESDKRSDFDGLPFLA